MRRERPDEVGMVQELTVRGAASLKTAAALSPMVHSSASSQAADVDQPLWQQIINGTLNLKTLEHAAEATLVNLAAIFILYIAARITIRLGTRAVARFVRSPAVPIQQRRRDTMESLLDNVIRYLVYFIFILMALQTLGLRVETLLAGAGIAGLALGFGAQSLIRDVLTGFFILFEDQYAVGDVVKINNVTGTVKTIGLRLTRLQVWTGEIEIIPNGQIQQITNYSRENSVAVIDIPVTYQADLDRAIDTMRRVMEQLRDESDDIVGEVKVLGLQTLRDNDVLLRATAVCKPTRNIEVQRLATLRIKRAFEAEQVPMK